MNLDVDRYCFVCGPENPQGLGITLRCADGKSGAEVTLRAEHQGYIGVSHGGIVAAVLDEAMVYAAATLGCWVATAEMTVRYHKPVPTDQPLQLQGEITRHQRRLVEARAEIRDQAGTLLASATGKLMQGKPLTESERDQVKQ